MSASLSSFSAPLESAAPNAPLAPPSEISGAVASVLLDGADEVMQRDFGERYAYRRVLGEGGQGVVIAAFDETLEREVAIKVLKKRDHPAHIQALAREARIGAQLEHPNILPTYDLGADEVDSPILVMRKIEGRSLEELLKDLSREGPEGIRRARLRLLNIFIAALHAVEFAHAHGVIHLDLKPANVSLGSHGEIYVIDWGFARRKEENIKRSGGTVHYVAPERLDGKNYDERADIFSLGVMLYRLLTGRHPRNVGGMPFAEYREKWREYPLIPASARAQELAPELAAIAHKAMADEPTERYAATREMITDLEHFMEMLPVSAYRESLWERAKRQVKKHRRFCAAAAAIILSALITAYALYAKHAAEQQRRQTENEKIALENAERVAAAERAEAARRRYEARAVLSRADDLALKSRQAVENAPTAEAKNEILAAALALFEKAEAIDPTYAEIYDHRAAAQKLAFNWTAALRDYEKAYQRDPSYLLALYEAGMLLADVFQQPDAAREKFSLMKTVSPDDEYAELGQAHVDLGEADRLLKLAPTHADYARRKELAAALYDAVLTRLDTIEKLNPALSDLWYLRGLIYQKHPTAASSELAKAAYDHYLAARRDSPSAFHNRGDARKNLGDIDGALADYTAALSINPEFIWSLRNRGYLLYKEKNDVAAALADINRAIAIAPQVAWSYVDRAAVYEGVGNFGAAERDYAQALALERQNPRILYRLGVLKFYQYEFADAEKYFASAIALDADKENSTAHYRRGLSRLAEQKYTDAIGDFETTIDLRRRLQPDGVIYPALMRFLAFRFSGQTPDAEDFGAQLNAPAAKPWLVAAGSFYLGEATENDVLVLANDPLAELAENGALYNGGAEQKARLLKAADLRAVCEARFYLGAYFLSGAAGAANDTDRAAALAKARAHLQAGFDSGERLYMEHVLCGFFLEKISVD
jgi:tetratricopeptide (TPR) repeat protein/predicted Ser/Thr protein kinase